MARSGRTRQCKGTAYAYRLRAKGRGEAKLRKRSLLLSIDTKARKVAVQVLKGVGKFLYSSSLRNLKRKWSSGQFAGFQFACSA